MAQRNRTRTGTFQARAAPGRLRLVQDFVNTRDVETGQDELWNPEKLARWLADRELVDAGTELDKDAWDNAVTIREALREQLRVHNGVAVEGRPMEILSPAFGDLDARLFLTGEGLVRVAGTGAGWPRAKARLLLAISTARNRLEERSAEVSRPEAGRHAAGEHEEAPPAPRRERAA